MKEHPAWVKAWNDAKPADAFFGREWKTLLDDAAYAKDVPDNQKWMAKGGTLQHVSLLQGTKAYGVHLHPIAIPARESDPRDDHANFFFDQQDYVRDAGEKHGFTYTVLRPQLVTGKMPGALNVYERFDRYKPRDTGVSDWTAGPKVVHYDRVEWTTTPDPLLRTFETSISARR